MSAPSPLSIRLPDAVKKQVDQLASLTDRSRSYLITEAVEKYVAERLAYLHDLDEAVAAIDTEPTYAADDVLTWMGTWGTDEEQSFSEANIPSR